MYCTSTKRIYFNISVIVLRTLKQLVLINNFNIKKISNKISKHSVLGTKKNFVKSLKLKELKPISMRNKQRSV